MKDKLRMEARIGAILSGMGNLQGTKYPGHDTHTQAQHDTPKIQHYTQSTIHATTPTTPHNTPKITHKSHKTTTMTDNVPAGTNDSANFWTGYVSSYLGGTNAGLQSRYELYIGFLHEKWG